MGDPGDRCHICRDQALNFAAHSPEDSQRDRKCRSARLERPVPKQLFQYISAVHVRSTGHKATTQRDEREALLCCTVTAAVVRCDHGVCPVQAKVAKSGNRLRVILRSPGSGRESLPGSGVRRRRASCMPTLRQEAFRSGDAWVRKAGGLGELAPGRQVWPKRLAVTRRWCGSEPRWSR